jgi:hypothetical protein
MYNSFKLIYYKLKVLGECLSQRFRREICTVIGIER